MVNKREILQKKFKTEQKMQVNLPASNIQVAIRVRPISNRYNKLIYEF